MTGMFADVISEMRSFNQENLGPSTAQFETVEQTRNEDTLEYDTRWLAGAELQCRFAAATARGANFKLDQPAVAGDWVVVVAAGTAVAVGDRAFVRGRQRLPDGTAELKFVRLVSVTKVVGPQDNDMLLKVYAVDVELVP